MEPCSSMSLITRDDFEVCMQAASNNNHQRSYAYQRTTPAYAHERQHTTYNWGSAAIHLQHCAAMTNASSPNTSMSILATGAAALQYLTQVTYK